MPPDWNWVNLVILVKCGSCYLLICNAALFHIFRCSLIIFCLWLEVRPDCGAPLQGWRSESSRVTWARGAARLRFGTGAGGPVCPNLVLLALLLTCWEIWPWFDCTTQGWGGRVPARSVSHNMGQKGLCDPETKAPQTPVLETHWAGPFSFHR